MTKAITELTLVIPTKNEEDNILLLLEKLKPLNIQNILFVDDSTDSTPDIILNQNILPKNSITLHHRLPHQRINGLSGAVLSAKDLIKTKYFALMDADHQHPPEVLLEIYSQSQKNPELEIISASRFLPKSKVIGLSPIRRSISLTLILFTKYLHKEKLFILTDPLTGLFQAKTYLLHNPTIKPNGFKLLLELILANPGPLNIKEIPFTFAQRHRGLSKATINELRSLIAITTRSRL